MNEAIVIIVHDRRADPIATTAIGHLTDWAGSRMVGSFWSVSDENTATAVLVDTDGSHDVGLLRSIAARPQPPITRIVAVATSALDELGTARLASAASRLAVELRHHAPAGRPVVEIRVIAPDDLQHETPLTSLLSPVVEANLVLVPEDRGSDTSFSVPAGLDDVDAYAGHVAAELATAAGLWTGMGGAPVDDCVASVIDNGDASVVFARSLARVACGPPLPLDDALAPGAQLPVPPGTEPAPDARRTAIAHAERMFAGTPQLHLRQVEPFDDRRTDVGLGGLLSRLAAEAKLYVRQLPRRFRDGAFADFEHVASEAVTHALGPDSIVNVIWNGKTDDDPDTIEGVDVTALRSSLEQRSRKGEPPRFDQQVWAGLVTDVLAAVDGGPSDTTTAPPSSGAQRLAIVEPAAIGPDPSKGLGGVTAALASEDVTADKGTLLGRVSALVRRQISQADQQLDHALTEIERGVNRLRRPHTRLAAVLSWTVAGIAAVITVLVAVGLHGAERVGMAHLGSQAITLTGIAVAVAASGVGAACLAAALRGTSGQNRPAWIACGATLLGGLLISWPLSAPRFHTADFGPRQLSNVVQVLTVAATLVIVLVIAASQKTRRGDAAARITGATLIVYLTIAAVGLIVRRNSWYERLAAESMRSTAVRLIVLSAIAAMLLVLLTGTLRVRERFIIGTASRRLRHLVLVAEQMTDERARLTEALRQYHGTAAALDAIVWWPCGRAPAASTKPTGQPAALEPPALKLAAFNYTFSDRSRVAVIARIRRRLAEPGWLQHQYAVAVEAFRPEFAYQTGTDIDVVAHRRPECDPFIEAENVGHTTAGAGPRWRFASMLYDRRFDGDLRTSASRLALDNVLEQYFQRLDSTATDAGENSGLGSFADKLVAGQPPRLPAQLFSRMALPVADDPRARYSTRVWWPSAALTCPTTNTKVERVEINHGNHALILPFIRTDWSQPFALHRLPIAPTRQHDERRLGEPDADCELGM